MKVSVGAIVGGGIKKYSKMIGMRRLMGATTVTGAPALPFGKTIRNLWGITRLSWLGLLAALLLMFGTTTVSFSAEVSPSPKVVFGHMANAIEAVNWAMGLGVNGLEMDLRFTSNNMPSEFRHSTPAITDLCDCSAGAAYLAHSDNVCKHMGVFMCHASTPAAAMLAHLAKGEFSNKLAVVYIDSKVDKSDAPPDLSIAGRNVIQFLDANLFAKGYKGQVIVSAGETKYKAYIKAAIEAANVSANKSRYFFAFDGQSSAPNLLPSSGVAAQEFQAAIQELINLGTANRVYAVGIAAILPGTFYDQVSLSAYNKKTGVLAATGIWTLDNKDAMNKYLNFGVDSIMTNVPGDALRVLADRRLPLAKPGEALHAATKNTLAGKLPAGEVCESNSNCGQGACGRGSAADGVLKICCPGGKYGTYAGYDYCLGMADGSVCWSDAQCAAGLCRGNNGGLKKGICGRLEVGQACEANKECKNSACGRGTAADGSQRICCPSGRYGTYAGYDYCLGMADGSVCWSDAQCATGYCRGNNGGRNKGICGRLEVGQACDANGACKNGACGRGTAADGAQRICCPSGRYGTYAGYDYCYGMPRGSVCWSDAMCAGGNCKGNMSGMKKGTCN